MSKAIIPIQQIAQGILSLRGQKVMLDYDLARLYGIETRALKQAVRRNRERFPVDFMFELSASEIEDVVSQFVIPSRRRFGGARPMAFTAQGVAMLSSVLKSERAVKVNIAIVRAFVKLPTKVSDVFGKYLFTARPQFAHLQLPAHQLRLLAEAAEHGFEERPRKPAAGSGVIRHERRCT